LERHAHIKSRRSRAAADDELDRRVDAHRSVVDRELLFQPGDAERLCFRPFDRPDPRAGGLARDGDLQRDVARGRRRTVDVPTGRDRQLHLEPEPLVGVVGGGVQADAGAHDLLVCGAPRRVRRGGGARAEQLGEEPASAHADAVVLLDEGAHDPAVGVEHEGGRERHPLLVLAGGHAERCVVGHKLGVEQPERADHPAALVSEKRIPDVVRVGEGFEARDGVVADREERIPGGVQLRQDPLQLDQLRLAIRSPPRAPIEDDERPAGPARGMQVHRTAVLVGEDDIGEAFAGPRRARCRSGAIHG